MSFPNDFGSEYNKYIKLFLSTQNKQIKRERENLLSVFFFFFNLEVNS